MPNRGGCPEQVAEDGSKKTMFSSVSSQVKWLIYLSTFSTVAYGYLIVAITAYLPEAGLSSADVGLILGVNGVAFAVAAVPLGIRADRRGRKDIFILGLYGIPPMIMIYAFTQDLLYLVVASVIAGISEGAVMSTWNALIADQTTIESRGAAFSLSFVFGTAGFGIGFALPMMFPLLEETFALDTHTVHSIAFVAVALLALVSPITLQRLLKDYVEELHPAVRKSKRPSRLLLYKFSGINALVGLGAGFIIPLIPTWLFLKFDITDEFSGPLLALSNIIMAIAAMASVSISKRTGVVGAIVLIQILSSVFMLSLAYVPTAVLAGGFYLVRAALMNMTVPLLDSYLMGIIEKDDRGFASALNTIIWRLPNSASTWVGGAMLNAGMLELPFIIAAAFYFA